MTTELDGVFSVRVTTELDRVNKVDNNSVKFQTEMITGMGTSRKTKLYVSLLKCATITSKYNLNYTMNV